MSVLALPRLTFQGTTRWNPNTVNNAPTSYDETTAEPVFADLSSSVQIPDSHAAVRALPFDNALLTVPDSELTRHPRDVGRQEKRPRPLPRPAAGRRRLARDPSEMIAGRLSQTL